MKTKTSFSHRGLQLLASSRFFWATVGLLLLEAVWIALSGRYPMAFDEDFHLGVIRVYAHHINPFLNAQPAGADRYGAVARDSSYLYHYLMSFPYRLISTFTSDQTIQVIVLRIINIALFATGLPLFRRLLLKTGASKALTHLCFLIFVLIPIVPLVAAQINYDNLVFPLVAVTLLLTLRISNELQVHKRIDGQAVAQLLIVCLLTSLVKYSFLPIFLAVMAYLIIRFRQTYPAFGAFGRSLVSGTRAIKRPSRWSLLVALLLSIGLFVQRDGVNVVRYHTPVPDCSKVLNVEACSDYGPWIRDYDYSHAKVNAPRSPLVFSADWFYGMWLRSFFTLDGPASQFQTRGPLLLPAMAGIIFPAVGTICLVAYGQRVFKKYNSSALGLLAIVATVYIVTLWLDEYKAFLHSGQPVAINGRYLLPVALPLLLLMCLAGGELLRKRRRAKVIVPLVLIFSLAWGGGALTYILRSNADWYWPNQTVRAVNQGVQRWVGPLIPGYTHPTEFLH